MKSVLLCLVFLVFLTRISSTMAQTGSLPHGRSAGSESAQLSDLAGKWVVFSTAPPTRFEIFVKDGEPHVKNVSSKTDAYHDCKDVKIDDGMLTFKMASEPVVIYKIDLHPTDTKLNGQMIITSFPYPVPVTLEKVKSWPTPEEIAARGPAGPAIVRK